MFSFPKRQLDSDQVTTPIKTPEEQIESIFKRIKEHYLSDELINQFRPVAASKGKTLNKNGLTEALDELRASLEYFEPMLKIELNENPKKSKLAIETAKNLETLIDDFFTQKYSDSSIKPKPSPERKQHIKQFRNLARRSVFSRRTKTLIAAATVGVIVAAAIIVVIIATQGLALMPIGLAIGLSAAGGVFFGALSGLIGHALFANKSENRGKHVVIALNKLNKIKTLKSFIDKKDQYLKEIAERKKKEEEKERSRSEKEQRKNENSSSFFGGWFGGKKQQAQSVGDDRASHSQENPPPAVVSSASNEQQVIENGANPTNAPGVLERVRSVFRSPNKPDMPAAVLPPTSQPAVTGSGSNVRIPLDDPIPKPTKSLASQPRASGSERVLLQSPPSPKRQDSPVDSGIRPPFWVSSMASKEPLPKNVSNKKSVFRNGI